MTCSSIITCAGSGTRAGFEKNKLLTLYQNTTYLERTIRAFLQCDFITEIIVTASAKDYDEICKITQNINKNIIVILGGDTRTKSVYNALKICSKEVVLIHDGARPFVSKEVINNCYLTTVKYGSGITCIPCKDTIATVQDNKILNCQRQNLHNIQTPQGFLLKDILKAYSQISQEDNFTDDSGVYAKYIKSPTICLGEEKNIKLTYKEDFKQPQLVGTGFDLHKLVEGRDLILGGIKIPHTKGLLGHSDADVLTHAIMDAMLSALSLGDIGKHFSDTDPRWKDISSIYLLKQVVEMIQNEGYKVVNISAVIMAEKPKLSTYTQKLSTSLAEVIHIEPKRVGITCTTLEGIGIVGREEGIACQAYCLLEKTY